MSDVTQILQQIESGDPSAVEQLLPLVYEELRKLATAWMSNESPDHTLQPADLIREAHTRLVGTGAPPGRENPHFLLAAAEAMRRILVDCARRQQGCVGSDNPDEARGQVDWRFAFVADDVLLIDKVIDHLADSHPQAADFLKLNSFADLEPAAVRRICRIDASVWTDHDDHDPGMTLLELFGWLADLNLYRPNQIPDRYRQKLLSLIRIPLKWQSKSSKTPDRP